MTDIPAIDGLADASNARVMLYQSGRQVHAPALGIGLQPLDATLSAIAALTGAADRGIYFTGLDQAAQFNLTAAGRALLDDNDAAAQRTTLGLGSAATKELTDWVAYTPTFTGFGTVTGISVWSRRVGDTLWIRGKFTTGTPTATEARMTLGFNGTNANVSSDATKVPSIQSCGLLTIGAATANYVTVLIESNIGYLTFALNNGFTKQNGSTVFGTTTAYSFLSGVAVPISGW